MGDFLRTNIMLVAVFGMSGIMFLWPEIQKLMGAGVAEKSPFDATRLMNDGATIIDVRNQEEFVSGHLPKAKNIALADFEKHIASIAKDKPVLLVCANGMRSRAAARILKKSGITQVFSMAGGMVEWGKAGLPLDKRK